MRSRSWPVFVATLVGAVGFYVLLATQRSHEDPLSFAPSSARYVHVATALLLPSLAYLVDWLVSPRRWAQLVAVPVVAAVVVANARGFARYNDGYVAESRQVRSEIAATVAMLDQLDSVGGLTQPYGRLVPFRIGHVRSLAAEGRLPCDTGYAEVVRVAAKLGVAPPPRRAVSCRST
jgi:hypothetical protein